jgi:radical SAM superfamily enzyme YgiQ (UPF0313 family)
VPQDVLLLSCYELGHQPLSLAWPLAFLAREGIEARAVDLSVSPFPEDDAAGARFVAIAVPMHTALRLGVKAAERVRRANPQAHICFHGLYAWLNAEYLLAGLADSVLAGESEQQLAELAKHVLHGTSAAGGGAARVLERLAFPTPDRRTLAPLRRYARFVSAGQKMLAGYTEASRGCRHVCRHCPVVPVYGGRFFVTPLEVVLADVRAQAGAGARHITFGDPDFLNGPGHALRVARALHAEFRELSFDFTTKVEHILKHRQVFAELRELGCAFVVSAVESLSDRVLARLRKDHSAADVPVAIEILEAAGIALHPTFVAFTPWTTLDDYIELIDFFWERGLASHIPPVQLSIRLLVPPRSALLEDAESRASFGSLDAAAFVHRWSHPDPRMDDLHGRVAALVEDAEARKQPAPATWRSIRALAYATAGRELRDAPMPPRCEPDPPRLTEHWFC